MITLNGTYCTMKEIVEIMGVSRQYIHMLFKKHKVRGIKITKTITLYDHDAIVKIMGLSDN